MQNRYFHCVKSFINSDLNLKCFSVLQLNVAGINNIHKFDKVKTLLTRLQTKCDIIVLSETKLKSKFPVNLYHLNGYVKYSCSRDSKNSGGGLMMYVKKDIAVIEHAKFSSTYEKLVLKIKVDGNFVTLLAYYRQPTSNSFIPFINDVEEELKKRKEKVLIIGDINLDARGDNAQSMQYLNLLKSFDMTITNTEPTRNASGRVIDHFSCNFLCDTKIENSTVTTNISYHNMIISQLLHVKTVNNHMRMKFERIDYENLCDTFSKHLSSSLLYDENDPNSIAEALTNITQHAIKKSTKSFEIRVKGNRKLCEWYSYRIAKAIKHKDNLMKKFKRNKSNVSLKQRVKLAAKKLKAVINAERVKYVSKSLEGKNTKKMWRNLNKLMGRGNKQQIAAVYDTNNNLVTNEEAIAEIFNKEFVESVLKLNACTNAHEYPVPMESTLCSIVLEESYEQEVVTVIKSLKNSSAPGLDGIKVVHIKALCNLISPIIVHLANRIFATGIFPVKFQVAAVVPISKTNDRTNIADYRPISTLSVLSKIIEKLLYTRLSQFINDKLKIISNHQYGFRKKCNTEIAALELVDYISNAIDNRKKVSLVFMDMKKAFDTVNVPKLLDVLNSYGIRGVPLELIESYLTNRVQVVKVGCKLSSPISFTMGVVQGSILGPFLFSLFINKITKLPTNGTMFLFADDCCIVNTHDLNEPVETKMKMDISTVINFLNYRSLIFNPNKTNFMICHSSYVKVEDITEIVMESHSDADNFTIKRVYNTKYLGLILDANLKWNEHISHIENKAANVCGVLWKMRNIIPPHAKKLIYQALLEPHLTYLVTLWGNSTDSIIKPLQVLQNRALRNVYGLDRLTSRVVMYTNLVNNFLPIRGLCYMQTAAFVYNVMHDKIHSNIKFEANIIETRQKGDLKSRKSRTSYGRRSIQAFGPKIYNEVPSFMKNLPHVHSFKYHLKKTIKTEEYISMFLSSAFSEKFT